MGPSASGRIIEIKDTMAPQTRNDESAPGTQEMAEIMANIAERSQRLVSYFIARNAYGKAIDISDAARIGAAFMELTQKMIRFSVTRSR